MTNGAGAGPSGAPAVLHVRSDVDVGYDELMQWSDMHHRVALTRPGWNAVQRYELDGRRETGPENWRILTVYELTDEAAAARRHEPDHATPPLPDSVGSVRRRRAVYVQAGAAVSPPPPGATATSPTLVQVLADVAAKDVAACSAWFAAVSPTLRRLPGIRRARALAASEVDGPPAGLGGDEWMELYEFERDAEAEQSVDQLAALPGRPESMGRLQVCLYRRNYRLDAAEVTA